MRLASRFWNRLFGQSSQNKKNRQGGMRRSNRHRSFSIEPLEERALLSICTWDGGGADNNWYTPANWVGDARPSAGDDLVFTGTVRTATNNNYGAGTQFGSITINNDDFSLSGNGIQLTGSINAASDVTDAEINLALTFLNNSAIIVGSSAELEISGNVSFPSKQLLVQGSGETTFSGTVSGGDFRTNANGTATFVDSSSLTTEWYTIAGSESNGTINWNSSGTLLPGTAVYVAFQGSGTFTQTAGTVGSANSKLLIGHSGAVGAYNLTGGTFKISTINHYASGSVTAGCAVNFAGGTLQMTDSPGYSITGLSYAFADSTTSTIDTQSYSWILGGAFSGSGNMTKLGSGTITLSGSNSSFTGTSSIQEGILKVGSTTALGGSGAAVVINDANEGHLDLNGFSVGAGTTLSMSNNQNGQTSAIQNSAAETATYAGNITLTGGTYIASGNGPINLSGDITGNYFLCAYGYDDTLVLSGTNSFARLAVWIGTVRLDSDTALTATTQVDFQIGTLNLNDHNVTIGDFLSCSGYSGTLQLGSGELTFGGSTPQDFAGAISGSGALVKQGTGTQTISGNNYNGHTSILAGTIKAGSSNALGDGTGTVSIDGSGVLDLNGYNITLSALNSTSANSRVTNDGGQDAVITVGGVTGESNFYGNIEDGATHTTGVTVDIGAGEGNAYHYLRLYGNNTYSGVTTINARQDNKWAYLLIAAENASSPNSHVNTGAGSLFGFTHNTTIDSLSGSGGVVYSSSTPEIITLTLDNDANAEFTGYFWAEGEATLSLVKQGSGYQTLSNSGSPHTGTTTINAGSLILGDSTVLANSTVTCNTADAIGFGALSSATFGGLAGDQNLTLPSGFNLTVGNNDGSTSFSGAISGSGNITKVGAGTLTLTEHNTYTGTTTVNEGTLSYGCNDAIASGAVVVNNDGTLNIDAFSDTVGMVTLNDGSIIGSTGTLSSTSGFTVKKGTVNANLGGSAGLTKTTSDTVTLSAANTYTGTTNIDGGTLTYGCNNAIASGAVAINNNSTLNIDAFSDTVGMVTLNDGSIVGSTGTLSSTSGFTVKKGTVSANLGGSTGLTKTTSDTVTLSTANVYTGVTNINEGILSFVENGLGTESSINFGGGTLRWESGNTQDISSRICAFASGVSAAFDTNNNYVTFTSVLSGQGGLTKKGSGTLKLDVNELYTGPTLVQGGTLNIPWNLNSHVTTDGGVVSCLVFHDPDLTAAVRESLGMSPDAVINANHLADLKSLTVDSNLISTLTGLEYATNLETLTLTPSDYSASSGSVSDLSPIDDLDNLTSLTLQYCGITDTVLDTDLIGFDNLETLDLRYNLLDELPDDVAALPSLTTLYVYGNEDLTDDPRAGLANLAGKLINVDIEPDNPESETTIAGLAAALYNLPIEIYEYVLNTIEYQPYQGAMKGALATLQTKAGNDWDTALLLTELLEEANANIETQYVIGRIQAPATVEQEYLGVTTTLAAWNVLVNSGLNPTNYVNEATALEFDHTWIQARFSPGGSWVSLDPSWKFQNHQLQPINMLSTVSFNPDPSDGDYFAQPKTEMASEFYEQQVRDYLAEYCPDMTIADIAYQGPIINQAIDELPIDLPYTVVGTPDIEASIPAVSEHRIRVTLWNSELTIMYCDSGILSLPEDSLKPLTIRPTDGTGAYVRPTLVQNWNTELDQAPDSTLLSTTEIIVRLEHYDADYDTIVDRSYEYERLAGDYMAVVLDANQISTNLIQSEYRAVNEANTDYLNDSETFDLDNNIGHLLNLVGLKFYYETDRGEQSICDLTAGVALWNRVSSGLTTSATTLKEVDWEQQFPCLPDKMYIDIRNMASNALSIDGSVGEDYLVRRRMMGYTNSAEENAIWEDLANIDSISTVKSFQLAREREVDIYEITSANKTTYLPLLTLSTSDKNAIEYYVDTGFTVFTPKSNTDLGDWEGVGYYAEKIIQEGNMLSYSTKYIISGGYNGGVQETIHGGFTTQDPAPITILESTQNQFYTPDPINIANGNVTHDETDLSVPNLGVPLTFSRHYDSFNTVPYGESPWSDRGMGEGWSFSYSDRLEYGDGGAIIWFTDKGIRLEFTPNGGDFDNPDGMFGTLSGTGLDRTWTDKTGATVDFDSDGKLYRMLDRYGNGVQVNYVPSTTKISTVQRVLDGAIATGGSAWSLTFIYSGDHVIQITDSTSPTPRVWQYGYDNGRLTSVTTPSDVQTPEATTGYEYYTDNARLGLLKIVTDPIGVMTQYDYYANRRGFEAWQGFTVVKTEVVPQSLSYNVFRDRTSFYDERRVLTYYTYDKENKGNLLEELFADHTTHTYTWSDKSLMNSSADAYGQTESYQYDANDMGDLIQFTDKNGHITTYTYYTANYHTIDTITRQNDPSDPNDSQVTKHYYNGSGSLTEKIDSYGDLYYHTVYTYGGAYGSSGLPDSVTTPKGYLTGGDSNDYKTTFTYNAAGQILTRTTRVSAGESITETFTYDNRGNLLTSTDGEENTTTYTYDLLNRRKTSELSDPDEIESGLPKPHTSYFYDAAGNLTSTVIDTATTTSRTTSIEYDYMQRVIKTTNPDGTYSTNAYDPAGNLVVSTDELGRAARYIYDFRNRLIATVLPDGSVVSTQYDGGGRVVGTTDALGNTIRYEYDELGRKVKIILPDPDGDGPLGENTTLYGYDAQGNLQYVTDTLGTELGDPNHTTEYVYDSLGRKIEEILPDPDGDGPLGRPTTYYHYDANGNLDWATDALGTEAEDPNHTTEYIYDEAGRLIQEILPDPDGDGPLDAPITRYFYDLNGNIRYVVDPRGTDYEDKSFTTEYVYDNLGRKVAEIAHDPDGSGPLAAPVTQYVYDASGNLDSVIDSLGQVTKYTYDLLGRQTGQSQYSLEGLVGYWKLDDGEAKDSSGNGNDGTLKGAGIQRVGGVFDEGLEFDGTNQVKVLDVPVDTADGAQNTISFWMKWDGDLSYIMACSFGF